MNDTTEQKPYGWLEIQNELYDIATAWGSNHAQADDFSKLRRDLFGRNSDGVLVHIASNMPADSDNVRQIIAKEWPYLLPPKVEVSLADRAFLENNMSARGQLIRELGESATSDLAKRYGHASLTSRAEGKRPEFLEAPDEQKKAKAAADRKSNPFSVEGWNTTKQGALLRAIGREKCAAIAAAVGSRIGATRPNPNF